MLRFWYRLSLEFGVPVAELQQRMSHSEFVHWQAFYSREPFGGTRSDLQTAQLLTMTANINRKKGSRRTKVDTFLPDYWNDRAKNLGRRISNALRVMGANVKKS